MVQPGIGFTLTDGIGAFVGRLTSIFTVFAACSSFGTEKLRISNPPFGAVSGTTLTCAPAGGAAAMTAVPTSTRTSNDWSGRMLIERTPPRWTISCNGRPEGRKESSVYATTAEAGSSTTSGSSGPVSAAG